MKKTVEAPGARRPAADECAPYYAGYFERVPPGDVVTTLRELGLRHARFFAELPPEKHAFRYAPGKWSVLEVLGHLIDTEWIFATRALWFARGDTTALPSMDQEVFVSGGRFGERSLEGLLEEYRTLRAATTTLAKGFDETVFGRTGVASGHRFSVRALLYFLAGHEIHHVDLLRERYL